MIYISFASIRCNGHTRLLHILHLQSLAQANLSQRLRLVLVCLSLHTALTEAPTLNFLQVYTCHITAYKLLKNLVIKISQPLMPKI